MNRETQARIFLSGWPETGPLRLLGAGNEAVVLTDGIHVYKYFTTWNPPPGQSPGPAELVAGLGTTPCKTLYPVEVHLRPDGLPLIVYPYEPSTPYSGGYEQDFGTFLLEMNREGLVMSNVHPDNFVVTANGLRLIDYGVSFHPWTRTGFRHMARRVWLTLCFPGAPDLKERMRRALTEDQLPENSGFQYFMEKNSLTSFVS